MEQKTQDQPKRMRATERRAFILAQAKKVFAQRGYAEASTSELAKASEVTEPMLYKHFGSKKQLYLALVREVGQQFIQRFSAMVEQKAKDDVRSALASLLLDYRAAALADRDGLSIFTAVTPDASDPELVEAALAHTNFLYSFVYQLLQTAQAQNILPASLDLSAAAWGYMSLLYGIQYRKKLGIFEQFNEQTIREINRLWLQSLEIG